ncbi:hypothetical protein PanWU01x14_158710, partial [Parasponia andersonii]
LLRIWTERALLTYLKNQNQVLKLLEMAFL